MKSLHGHTLVELLFCLLIAGILLALATPTFVAIIERSRQAEAINQLLGALNYARTKAMMEHKIVAICAGITACEGHETWQGRILIFEDRNGNGQLDAGDELLRTVTMPEGLVWYWRNFRRQNHMQFQPDGTTRALNGTFTLCRDGAAKSQIVINLPGRARRRSPSENARCG